LAPSIHRSEWRSRAAVRAGAGNGCEAMNPSLSVWRQVFLEDPVFLVFNLGLIVLVVVLAWVVRRRYARFYRIQRESLDHRKSADAQALARQESFEQLVARHYDAINSHNARLIATSEQAMRLNADMLAQIASVNATLNRIAERLDRPAGQA
jgi:hypothetical protein